MLNEEHPERCQLNLEPNEKIALCRCWQSKKFPYCDGSHRAWNQEHNDQLGPAIITCHKDTSE